MIFLTRDGCHLCDEALTVVRHAMRRLHLDLVVVDVDTDDELLKRYGLRIPVLMTEGHHVVAEGEINDQRRLRRALKRLG